MKLKSVCLLTPLLWMSSSSVGQTQSSSPKLSTHLHMIVSGDPALVKSAARALNIKSDATLPAARIAAFVRFQGDAAQLRALLSRYGGRVDTVVNGIATVEFPIRSLAPLAGEPTIIGIEEPKPVHRSSDISVPATGANAVWGSGSRPLPPHWVGNTGKESIVGVVDSGIDLTHPDFIDPNGSTRILSLWDQSSPSGTPPTGFVLGNERKTADINAVRQKTDLVVVNAYNATFSTLQSNGGSFGGAVKRASGTIPVAAVVADFDLDGFPDVAVADAGDGSITIHLGNGNGTFSVDLSTSVLSGQQATSLVSGDFDKDGKPDLAVVFGTGATVAVLLGNGDGSFGPPDLYPVGRDPRSW